jgi:hypothetical protein
MDVYSWMIFLYVAGTALVGWVLLHEAYPPGQQDKHFAAGFRKLARGTERVGKSRHAVEELFASGVSAKAGKARRA